MPKKRAAVTFADDPRTAASSSSARGGRGKRRSTRSSGRSSGRSNDAAAGDEGDGKGDQKVSASSSVGPTDTSSAAAAAAPFWPEPAPAPAPAAASTSNAGASTVSDALVEAPAAAVAAPAPSAPTQQPPPPTTTTTTTTASITCPNCGSHEIEQHDQSGASVCIECGVVVEENAIVSSIEFVEGTGGSSSMVGQFVSATSSKAFTGGGGGGRGGGAGGPGGGGLPGLRGGRYGFSRDSRETTLANGRRRIQDVASRLRLGSHFVDSAHRLFTVAVERNFVQGRRTTHVVAACLYIACRQEKSQHMLIDFSDALQVNVYTLGTCFLKFRRLLGLKLEIIDPALYVYRFAAHLDLDDKANGVALTALRLVGRMKRDWIVAGRRPAGICAAALLIAARAHGFTRRNQDVTKILRVCGLTVSTRVKEFESTPSARLTLEQFNQVDVESEADPPVFTRNRIREARARAIQDGNVELLQSGALDDPRAGKRGSKWREVKPSAADGKHNELNELYDSLEKEMKEENRSMEAEAAAAAEADAAAAGDDDEEEGGKKSEEMEVTDEGDATSLGLLEDGTYAAVASTGEKILVPYPKGNSGRDLILSDQATAEELRPPTEPTEDKLNLEEWKGAMPSDFSSEFDDIFCNEDEVRQKEALFNSMNREYLAQQERKESERANAEAADKYREVDEAAQEEGRARYLKSSAPRRGRRRGDGEGEGADADEPTTEEALLAAVSTRKISRKINYDAMSAIFDDSGGFSTDGLDGAAREGAEGEPVDAEFI